MEISCEYYSLKSMCTHQICPVHSTGVMPTAPPERDPRYFPTWQRTSVALQRALREWIPERYFQDVRRFENRAMAYQFLVYAACRPCYGRPRTEFTFDVADPGTLNSALHNTGRSLAVVLASVERRLCEAGLPELGRRYAPIWRQDIMRTVKNKPRRLIALLASEAKVVEAVIDLGTVGDVSRFTRAAGSALRNISGEDMRDLASRAVDEAIRILSDHSDGSLDHVADGGVFENHRALAAGSPDGRVSCEENGDEWHAGGSGQVSDPGIIADVDAGRPEPAGQIVQVAEPDGVFENILGTGDPFNRHMEPSSDGSEVLERPVFSYAS